MEIFAVARHPSLAIAGWPTPHFAIEFQLGTNMHRFSANYLEALFVSREYEKLAELSAIICGSPGFRAEAPDYGLPMPAFTFVECLLWFAQAVRSGVWTYFEATPTNRQQALLGALERLAPSGFAKRYAFGCQFWRDEMKMKELDQWMDSHDEENTVWLWSLVNAHRHTIQELCA
jgi:hypothetical protein